VNIRKIRTNVVRIRGFYRRDAENAAKDFDTEITEVTEKKHGQAAATAPKALLSEKILQNKKQYWPEQKKWTQTLFVL